MSMIQCQSSSVLVAPKRRTKKRKVHASAEVGSVKRIQTLAGRRYERDCTRHHRLVRDSLSSSQPSTPFVETVAHWYWRDGTHWRRYVDFDQVIEHYFQMHICSHQIATTHTDHIASSSLVHFSINRDSYCINLDTMEQHHVPLVAPNGQAYQVRQILRVERNVKRAPMIWPEDWVYAPQRAGRMDDNVKHVIIDPLLHSTTEVQLFTCTDEQTSQSHLSTTSSKRQSCPNTPTHGLIVPSWLEATQTPLALSNPLVEPPTSTPTHTLQHATVSGVTIRDSDLPTPSKPRVLRSKITNGQSRIQKQLNNQFQALVRPCFVPNIQRERTYVLQSLSLDCEVYANVVTKYLASVGTPILSQYAVGTPGCADYQPAVYITTGYSVTIDGVYQIQNTRVRHAYDARKQQIQNEVDELGVFSVEQTDLFHGTSLAALPHILEQGLCPSLSTYKHDRALRGHGIYVAPKASFATYYAQPGAVDGVSVVLSCSALTGLSEIGQRGQCEPHRVPNTAGRLFNSTLDFVNEPDQYCLWTADQVLPKFALFVRCTPLPTPTVNKEI